MSTKEYYEICNHEYTIKHGGSRVCLTSGLEMRDATLFDNDFSQETDYDSGRFFLSNRRTDHVVEIRERMRELMSMIIRKIRECKYTGEIYYTEPPQAGLPRELWGYSEELCKICNEYLWITFGKKLNEVLPFGVKHAAYVLLCCGKKLYPMSMAEFVRRVGVSKPTIINTCKKMRQIDLN